MFGFNKREQKTITDNVSNFKFDFAISDVDFVKFNIINLYKKILFMIYDKMKFDNTADKEKDKEYYSTAFFENYAVGEEQSGIIQNLACAMQSNSQIHLVCVNISKGVFVVRKATNEEDEEFNNNPNLKNHVKFDFSNLYEARILKVYYSMIYWIIKATNTHVRISNTILLKISKLRELVAKEDSDPIIKQGNEIITALKEGASVITDKDDSYEKIIVDSDSTTKALDIVYGLIAGLLNQPISFINGVLTTGLTQTGDSDNLAIERGLIGHYYSIMKPCVEKLLDVKTSFIKDNTSRLKALIGLLPSLEVSDLLTDDEKREIIERLK